jgi:hypothetical protein
MNIDQVLAVIANHAPHLAPQRNGNPDYTATFDDGGMIDASDPNGPWELIGVNREIWFSKIETEQDLIKALKTYVPLVALDFVESSHDPILPTHIGNFFYDFLYHVSWKLHGMQAGIERQVLADKVLMFLNQGTNPPGFHKVAYSYFTAFKLGIA